jgi:tryptophanyl-tRNA synthetase
VGLRNLAQAAPQKKLKTPKSAAAEFKQYRGEDRQFYFKLIDAQGKLLLQSRAFAEPRAVALAIARLQQVGNDALADLKQHLEPAGDSAALTLALEALMQARSNGT